MLIYKYNLISDGSREGYNYFVSQGQSVRMYFVSIENLVMKIFKILFQLYRFNDDIHQIHTYTNSLTHAVHKLDDKIYNKFSKSVYGMVRERGELEKNTIQYTFNGLID